MSYGSTPTYLIVFNSILGSITTSTFIESQYSLDVDIANYMAYDGWLYGKSKSDNSKYCKFSYTNENDIPKSYASFNCSNPACVVADPKTKLAYDITSGWTYSLTNMSNYTRSIKLYHHSSGDDVPMCVNTTLNPEIGFILCAKGWDFFEINFRLPKLNSTDFASLPDARLITEVNVPKTWAREKILVSYDGKNLLRIPYEVDSKYTHEVYLYRR